MYYMFLCLIFLLAVRTAPLPMENDGNDQTPNNRVNNVNVNINNHNNFFWTAPYQAQYPAYSQLLHQVESTPTFDHHGDMFGHGFSSGYPLHGYDSQVIPHNFRHASGSSSSFLPPQHFPHSDNLPNFQNTAQRQPVTSFVPGSDNPIHVLPSMYASSEPTSSTYHAWTSLFSPQLIEVPQSPKLHGIPQFAEPATGVASPQTFQPSRTLHSWQQTAGEDLQVQNDHIGSSTDLDSMHNQQSRESDPKLKGVLSESISESGTSNARSEKVEEPPVRIRTEDTPLDVLSGKYPGFPYMIMSLPELDDKGMKTGSGKIFAKRRNDQVREQINREYFAGRAQWLPDEEVNKGWRTMVKGAREHSRKFPVVPIGWAKDSQLQEQDGKQAVAIRVTVHSPDRRHNKASNLRRYIGVWSTPTSGARREFYGLASFDKEHVEEVNAHIEALLKKFGSHA